MFGKSNGNGKEPRLTPLPPVSRSAAVETWLTEHEKLEQENAYLRDEVNRLSNALKVETESYLLLKDEMGHVRDQLDYISRHDHFMLNTLDNVAVMITAAKAKARERPYAPPGSGNDTSADRTAEAQEKIDEAAAVLAGKLAPEPVSA